MLRSLYIRDYALIDELSVQFDKGLNVITGETGAGKSIILGAFSLLMGERATRDVLRKGSTKAIVEGEFELGGNEHLTRFLADHEFERESERLIVRREVTEKGSRGFINDTPATQQLLAELSDYLVDLHGQHEHQSLLRADRHILFLDQFGDLENDVAAFSAQREKFYAALAELSELQRKTRSAHEEQEFIRFQLDEILAVDPTANEDVQIESKLSRLEHAEELRTIAGECYQLLYESDSGAYEALSKAKQLLERGAKLDSSLVSVLEEVQSALVSATEAAKSISRYGDQIELKPDELNELRLRSQAIQRLKKKHGGSLDEVIAKRTELSARLGETENLTEKIEAKSLELTQRRQTLTILAKQLTEARGRAARKLEKKIIELLKELGIEKARFDVRMSNRELAESEIETAPILIGSQPYHAGARGMDIVEFFISTNPGEDVKPLAKVASGGEISRIMLALKSMLAERGRLPLLIFDEIDVGVSGRIAQRVGSAMRRLAEDHQVIAISHLAQIAAFSDAHYLVSKTQKKGETHSSLRPLSESEHVEEIARLISGAEVSKESLSAANRLIEEASRPIQA